MEWLVIVFGFVILIVLVLLDVRRVQQKVREMEARNGGLSLYIQELLSEQEKSRGLLGRKVDKSTTEPCPHCLGTGRVPRRGWRWKEKDIEAFQHARENDALERMWNHDGQGPDSPERS